MAFIEARECILIPQSNKRVSIKNVSDTQSFINTDYIDKIAVYPTNTGFAVIFKAHIDTQSSIYCIGQTTDKDKSAIIIQDALTY